MMVDWTRLVTTEEVIACHYSKVKSLVFADGLRMCEIVRIKSKDDTKIFVLILEG